MEASIQAICGFAGCCGIECATGPRALGVDYSVEGIGF
jgi:hypothetical protein